MTGEAQDHTTRYGRVERVGDQALVDLDGALDLQRLSGAVVAVHDADDTLLFALELDGERLARTDGRMRATGDTVAAVWLASQRQVGELVASLVEGAAAMGGRSAVDAIFVEARRRLAAR